MVRKVSTSGGVSSWAELTDKPAVPDSPDDIGAAPVAHTHGVTDLTATGTRSASTVLHGDNTWKVPSGATSVVAAARKHATTVTDSWDNAVVEVNLAGTSFTNAAFDMTVANTIKVNAAGLYLVTVELGMGGTQNGVRTGLIRVNGTTVREFGFGGTTNNTVRMTAVATLPLAANDAITLGSFATSGNDSVKTIFAAPSDTGLTVTRLA